MVKPRSVLHAFSHGKATIVSDIAWFSELPNSIVKKVPTGMNEVSALIKILSNWINNPQIPYDMGKAALSYSKKHLSYEKISILYSKVFEML